MPNFDTYCDSFVWMKPCIWYITNSEKPGTIHKTINSCKDNASKTIESIHFHSQDIYLNGEVISPITTYYVNSEDRDKYRTTSQLAIKQLLNYPDTAKFPAISGWAFGIEDDIVIVQSTVTAKNAFDMESTSTFQI